MNDKKVILLDPGHGFGEYSKKYQRPLVMLKNGKVKIIDNLENNPMEYTIGFYREDHGTLLIATEAAKYLSDMGYKVYLTRSDYRDANAHLSEVFLGTSWQKTHWKSWQWITMAANKYKADILVSIHTNASTNHKASGVAAFYANEINGKKLSTLISQEISKELGLKIKRIDKHAYLILKDTCNGNACLVECAFHDNLNDLTLLTDNNCIDKFGKSIANGINIYLNSLNKL